VNRGFPRPSESRPEWAHEEQRGRSETAPLRLKLVFHFRTVKELCRQRFHPIRNSATNSGENEGAKPLPPVDTTLTGWSLTYRNQAASMDGRRDRVIVRSKSGFEN
jgi:hypothetical protein